MNIYIYKTEKHGINPNRVAVKLTAECQADNVYLQHTVELIKGRELLKDELAALYRSTSMKRLSAAQSKMHEAIGESTAMKDQVNMMVGEYNKIHTELAKVKKTWVYRVLKFFLDNFSITKPRRCK